jgi:hypothetical protein
MIIILAVKAEGAVLFVAHVFAVGVVAAMMRRDLGTENSQASRHHTEQNKQQTTTSC